MVSFRGLSVIIVGVGFYLFALSPEFFGQSFLPPSLFAMVIFGGSVLVAIGLVAMVHLAQEWALMRNQSPDTGFVMLDREIISSAVPQMSRGISAIVQLADQKWQLELVGDQIARTFCDSKVYVASVWRTKNGAPLAISINGRKLSTMPDAVRLCGA